MTTRVRSAAAVVVLGALAAVAVAASLTSAHRVLTPAEARRRNGSVQVRGTATRITPGPRGRALEFVLRGGGAGLRVRYLGLPPDGLRAGASVTVTGRLHAGALTAQAGGIETRCTEQHC